MKNLESEFNKKPKNRTKKDVKESDTLKMLEEMMGVKKTTSFFRPISQAIVATDVFERARDSRKLSLNTAAGEIQDPFVRIGQKMELARAIYGERARADQLMKAKEEAEKEAERLALSVNIGKRKKFAQKHKAFFKAHNKKIIIE